MIIQRRQPTQKDFDNLAALRTGGSPGSNSGVTPDLLRSSQDPKEQLTPEQLKIQRNDRDREARLKRMQDRLEVVSELRESGYLIHKINI